MFFIPAFAFAGTSPTFPTGWRASTNDDYSTEDLSFVNNIAPNHVVADFNGDGLTDEAWILLKDTENVYGLFVFFGVSDKKFKTIKLIEYKKETSKLYMGISILESGSHKTACGKGYWDCDKDEPEILRLENPSIDFFAFESANSVYYWEKSQNKFKRVWLSD